MRPDMKAFIIAVLCCILYIDVWGQTLESLTQQVKTSIRKNNYKKADSIIFQASDKQRAMDTTMARLHHQIGLYFFYKNDEKTISHFKHALAIWEAVLDSTDKLISNEYYNLGIKYRQTGQDEIAIRYLKRSIELRIQANDPALLQSYTEIAIIYDEKGDYNRALNYYDLVIQTLKEKPNKDAVTLSYAYKQKAILQRKRQKYVEAIGDLNQALSIYQRLDSLIDMADCYASIGDVYQTIEELDSAILYYQKAVKLYERYNEVYSLGELLNNLAISYRKQAKFDEARACLLQSLKLKEAVYREVWHPQYASNYDNWGDIERDEGNYQDALCYYHEAIRQIIPSFQSDYVTALPHLEQTVIKGSNVELLTLLSSKARTFRLLYIQSPNKSFLKSALDHYHLANQLVDIMRYGHTAHDSKLFWREKTRSIYEEAMEVCYLLNDLEQAFYFAEKSKSMMLLDALHNAVGLDLAGMEDSLVEKEYILKSTIYILSQEIQDLKRDTNKRDSLKQQVIQKQIELEKRNREYEELIQYLEEAYPKYYQVKYNNTMVSTEDVQAYLPDSQTAFVEYIIGDTSIFALCLTKTHKQLSLIPLDYGLREHLNTLRSLIRENTPAGKNRELLEKSWLVYATILKPVLPPDVRIGKLILSLDGILHNLPFEVLLDEPYHFGTDKRDIETAFKDASFLIHTYPIHYTYSANILLEDVLSKRIKEMSIMAFTNPFFNGKFESLKGSWKEVKAIEKNAGITVDNYQGDCATETSFKQFAKEYAILHLATHGVADSTNPLDSKLIFAQNPDSSMNDGYLHTSEIFAMKLNASLVVLSACETGVGKLQKGEGIMNLARAFAYAGCTNTVSSIWELNDDVSATIMGDFYRYLDEGYCKDEALRKAKLDHLKTANSLKSHPFHWASMILIGDAEPLKSMKKYIPYKQMAVLVLVLLLVSILIFTLTNRYWRG